LLSRTNLTRSLEGTNLSDQNLFVVLNNLDIMNLAVGMGVHIGSEHFESVDIMKDLECARHALDRSKNCEIVDPNDGIEQEALDAYDGKLLLEWKENSESKSFTVVRSSKNKRNKAKLKNLVVAIPIMRSMRSTPSVYKSMGDQENPAPSKVVSRNKSVKNDEGLVLDMMSEWRFDFVCF
jgi:hypothetical protein